MTFIVTSQNKYIYVEDFGALGNAKNRNAEAFLKCFNYAIKNNKTVKFKGGIYVLEKTININLPENKSLNIEGNNSLIKMIPFKNKSTDYHYFGFHCEDGSESTNNQVSISNLNFDASSFVPVWMPKNFFELKIVKAVNFFDIYKVTLTNCNFNNIFGYGVISYGVVNMTYQNVNFRDVGGHFPLENQYDRYGDAIYFSIYDLENRGRNRKVTNLRIMNCIIQGYSTNFNGNFASRIGVCLEGYKSASVQGQKVNVLIKDSQIQYYDRSIHQEALNADFIIENVLISDYESYFVNVYSKGSVLFKNCTIKNPLKNNPQQERFGNGKIKSFTKDDYIVKFKYYNTKIVNE